MSENENVRTRTLWKDAKVEIAIREGPGGEVLSICMMNEGRGFWRSPKELLNAVWADNRWKETKLERALHREAERQANALEKDRTP